jgi:RNA-directed DNA polymerase
MHHVTPELLAWAFHQLKARAAPGVDGVTWEEYAGALDGNIDDLHRRVMRGGYRAKPSRRQYIPKADGRQRPLGIAAREDKIVLLLRVPTGALPARCAGCACLRAPGGR